MLFSRHTLALSVPGNIRMSVSAWRSDEDGACRSVRAGGDRRQNATRGLRMGEQSPIEAQEVRDATFPKGMRRAWLWLWACDHAQ